MAVTTELSWIAYTGNGSTSIPYPVPFPFQSPEHIRVKVWDLDLSGQRIGNGVVLGQNDYSVLIDGNPRVTTRLPQPANKQVNVYRLMPYSQARRFPEGGEFASQEVEAALDWIVMLVQQALRAFDGSGIATAGDGSVLQDGAVWGDQSARGAVIPTRAGQLGVQLSNKTIWIGNSRSVGDWSEFSPKSQPTDDRLAIAFAADTGVPGVGQNALASLFQVWNPDAVLLGGDNSYSSGGASAYDADLAVFGPWITSEKLFACLGNHDLDDLAKVARHAQKFAYFPGNRRYFSKVFGNGLLELFVLNDGLNSSEVVVSDGGLTVGGTQHQWFVQALNASMARWKIVLVHRPPVSCIAGADRTNPALDWPELARVDAVLCGHGHTTEILSFRGVPILNFSAAVKAPEGTTYAPTTFQGVSTVYFAGESTRAARILLDPLRMIIESWHPDGYLTETFELPLSTQSAVHHIRGRAHFEMLEPGDSIDFPQLSRAMVTTGATVTVDLPATISQTFSIKVGPHNYGTITLAAGQKSASCRIPALAIGEGHWPTVTVASAATGYAQWAYGLSLELKGRWIS